MYFCSFQYVESIENYTKALELKPDEFLYWNNRGNAFFELARYEVKKEKERGRGERSKESLLC